MNLKAIKTEEIVVDASELQDQINNLYLKYEKYHTIPSYTFDDTELKSQISTLEAKLDNYIKFDTSTDSNFNESIGSLQKEIVALKDQLANYKPEVNIEVTKPANKFEFVLEKDAEGFSDTSWENIIREGQKIQYEYWKKAEEDWNKKFKMYEGWHGSAMAPVIKIVCEEPEYIFKNTVRLPGRFCLSSNRRWSSILRFYTIGDKVLIDDTGYGHKWDAPVCVYVEGKTYTKMPDGGTMVMKPFEQTIEEVIIVPMNKGIPVYLCENQDRFL